MTEINAEKKIKNILVLTHGNWGEELIKSARMILGNFENVESIPLQANETLNDYLEKVKEKIKLYKDKTLIFADLFGGTPSNIAALLSREYDIVAISGLNLSMLIESIMTRDNYSANEAIEQILRSGKENCKDIIKTVNEKYYKNLNLERGK